MTLLDPDNRHLYTDALRPPPGFRFGEALATTYSLDLETLLTIPLHLALFSAEQPIEEFVKDGVALLESLRRTTDHLTVYAQTSRILAPAAQNVLYGLLEPTVIETRTPAEAGSFHPKLWVIRFDHRKRDQSRLRLLVLSRNVTADRCWDLVLTLEGRPGASAGEGENEGLAELLSALPRLADRRPDPSRVQQARDLAAAVARCEWELPAGFEAVGFHATGLRPGMRWRPADSRRLAVISPFVTAGALQALLQTTRDATALVSRPEELAKVSSDVLGRFDRVTVLAEQAEVEDGEEVEATGDLARPSVGLHAKAYIAERGRDTHLYLGSANATDPVIAQGSNVELIAELVGKTRRVGGVDDLLSADGFGVLLTDHLADEDDDPEDPAVEAARKALDRGRRALGRAGLTLRFRARDEGWGMTLEAEAPVEMPGVDGLDVWLVTRHRDTAVPADRLLHEKSLELRAAPLSLLTSFVAFELRSDDVDESLRFVLKVRAENMPVEERDAAVVRDVIRNREGFLRYVMLLLAEAGDRPGFFGGGGVSWDRMAGRSEGEDLPLFEHMTRAFCREPSRLESIRRLMEEVASGEGGDVVPPEFVELWSVYESALDAEEGAPV